MPARNVVKQYQPQSYYHVYNRGVEKRVIFVDEFDYRVFLNLLKRHLSPEQSKDKRGNVYKSYDGDVELLAYCLMPNHFHLLFYLEQDTGALTELIRKISGTYTSYFNKRHKRVGHLFQGVYKASRISTDAYMQHISRYIHLNPKNYRQWEYSSYNYFVNNWAADWVKPKRILDMFEQGEYAKFVSDYEAQKEIMDELKYELADK